MKQTLLTPGRLLDENGRLAQAGYATSPVRTYDRSAIRASRLRIKEWDYYLVYNGAFGVALTLADNGYMGLLSASFLDFENRAEHTVSRMFPFPLGQTRIDVKLLETRLAIEDGADEIDYVVNLTELKAGNLDYVQREMASIAALCREKGVLSKVIFENCYLTDAEKRSLCAIAREVGPDFVKTSTGFGTGGATFADVELMVREVGPGVRVKAAGGIRTLEDALRYIDLGVSRIGSTASVRIVDAFREKYGE